MSITDELREWAKDNTMQDKVLTTYPAQHPVHGTVESLLRIADRIDAEHKKDVERARMDGIDATFGDGWVKLPVDADGVPIHIGDRVENNERVVRIVLTDGSCEPSVYVEKLPNVLHEYFCNEVSHHHSPTVEDVLREFAEKMNENMGLYTGEVIDVDEWRDADAKTVEKFAAKLRLANDGKEQ
jgi:hypothetical protein